MALKHGWDWQKVAARQTQRLAAGEYSTKAEGLPENRMRDHDPEDVG